MIISRIEALVFSLVAVVLVIAASSNTYKVGENIGTRIYGHARTQTLALLNPANRGSGGTGFAIDLNGRKYTLTNAHICKMTDKEYLDAQVDKGQIQRLKIIAISDETDLCLVEPMPGLSGLKLAKTMEMYQKIYVVGHPLLMPISLAEGFVNNREAIDIFDPHTSPEGCVGEHRRRVTVNTMFGPLDICVVTVDANWSDAKIFPGNSGSPVMNSDGDVVGVIFAGSSENFSFFIPLDAVLDFVASH